LLAAAARAVALLEAVADARVVAVAHVEGERPATPPIRLRAARVALLLGMAIPDAAIERILAGLGIAAERVATAAASEWRCAPPSHRPDLTIEEDLVEEIMRHHGLDALPAVPARPSDIPPPRPLRTRAALHDRLVDGLVGRGLHEIVGYAFTGADKLALLDPPGESRSEATWVRVTNPMRGPMAVMRTHMLPALLDAAVINGGRHARALALFEYGRVYAWEAASTAVSADGPTAAVDRSLPRESPRLAILRAASRDTPEPPAALARALGLDLLHTLRRAGIEAEVAPLRPPGDDARDAATSGGVPAWLHPGCAAALRLPSGALVGVFGEVHPRVRDGWDWPAERALAYGELHLEALLIPGVPAMSPLPRFPGSARDLSLEVDDAIAVHQLVAALATAGEQLRADDPATPGLVAPDAMAQAVEWIEDYRGEGVPSGYKATLLRLHYRASGGSVTDEAVQALHERVVDRALAQLAAQGLAVRRR
jgi:phenylalanyl-tRNA synthetase beta chain